MRGRRRLLLVAVVVGVLRGVRRTALQQPRQLASDDALELALLRPRTVQHRHLQALGGDLPLAAVGVAGQGLHRELQRLRQRHAVPVTLIEIAADLLGVAADRDRAVLVHDRTVVRQPVDLVTLRGLPHLGDHQLHLVRLLRRTGEDRAQRLRVDVRQTARGHVVPVVGVTTQVGVAHTADAQILVLVVLAGRGEADPVVDLAELVQRTGRILTDEHDAVGVLQHYQAAAAGDALAGVLGPVGHGLLG
ncbi:hypothetical protein ACE1SV_49350 [Streptomyces sennicomposti]